MSVASPRGRRRSNPRRSPCVPLRAPSLPRVARAPARVAPCPDPAPVVRRASAPMPRVASVGESNVVLEPVDDSRAASNAAAEPPRATNFSFGRPYTSCILWLCRLRLLELQPEPFRLLRGVGDASAAAPGFALRASASFGGRALKLARAHRHLWRAPCRAVSRVSRQPASLAVSSPSLGLAAPYLVLLPARWRGRACRVDGAHEAACSAAASSAAARTFLRNRPRRQTWPRARRLRPRGKRVLLRGRRRGRLVLGLRLRSGDEHLALDVSISSSHASSTRRRTLLPARWPPSPKPSCTAAALRVGAELARQAASRACARLLRSFRRRPRGFGLGFVRVDLRQFRARRGAGLLRGDSRGDGLVAFPRFARRRVARAPFRIEAAPSASLAFLLDRPAAASRSLNAFALADVHGESFVSFSFSARPLLLLELRRQQPAGLPAALRLATVVATRRLLQRRQARLSSFSAAVLLRHRRRPCATASRRVAFPLDPAASALSRQQPSRGAFARSRSRRAVARAPPPPPRSLARRDAAAQRRESPGDARLLRRALLRGVPRHCNAAHRRRRRPRTSSSSSRTASDSALAAATAAAIVAASDASRASFACARLRLSARAACAASGTTHHRRLRRGFDLCGELRDSRLGESARALRLRRLSLGGGDVVIRRRRDRHSRVFSLATKRLLRGRRQTFDVAFHVRLLGLEFGDAFAKKRRWRVGGVLGVCVLGLGRRVVRREMWRFGGWFAPPPARRARGEGGGDRRGGDRASPSPRPRYPGSRREPATRGEGSGAEESVGGGVFACSPPARRGARERRVEDVEGSGNARRGRWLSRLRRRPARTIPRHPWGPGDARARSRRRAPPCWRVETPQTLGRAQSKRTRRGGGRARRGSSARRMRVRRSRGSLATTRGRVKNARRCVWARACGCKSRPESDIA